MDQLPDERNQQKQRKANPADGEQTEEDLSAADGSGNDGAGKEGQYEARSKWSSTSLHLNLHRLAMRTVRRRSFERTSSLRFPLPMVNPLSEVRPRASLTPAARETAGPPPN